MKNGIYIFLMLFVGLPFISISQQHRPFVFGLNAGLNASNQHVRGTDASFTTASGIRVAATLEKPITNRFSLISELAYAQHGSKEVFFSGRNEELNYAEFNVQATEYVPAGGSDVYFALGLFSAYGLNGKQTMNGTVVLDKLFDQTGYQRFDWGLIMNAGLKLKWGTYIQAGYKAAFSSCNNEGGVKYFNTAFMVTVGQSFGWQKKKSLTFRKNTP